MENYGHESLGTQIDGMNFQTHFRACLKKAFIYKKNMYFNY